MTKINQLVYVKWVDAEGGLPDWTHIDEIVESPDEQMIVHTVGWLVAKGESKIVIVPHWYTQSEEDGVYGCGNMDIPRCSILEVIPLNQTAGVQHILDR